MNAPAVSVCIPVYNGERYISETIRSVFAQTFGDFEVVVSDNCSTDATVEIVSGFGDDRVRLLRNTENLGAVENWNAVVESARGRYVKLLCADDLLYPRCLELQVEALDAHPNASFAAARRDIVGADGVPVIRDRGLFHMRGEVPAALALRRTVQAGTNPFGEPAAVLMRTEARKRAGEFSGQRPYMIDVDMWVRLLAFGPVVAVAETVCAFRLSFGSWSHELSREQARQTRALFRELRARHPETVRATDLVRGSVRAAALNVGRRLAYVRLNSR